MGPLADWDCRRDLLADLTAAGLHLLADQVLGLLSAPDLRAARSVSWTWLGLVEAATSHRERGRLGRGWRVGEPGVQSLQCRYREKVLLQTDNTADLSLSVARSGVW